MTRSRPIALPVASSTEGQTRRPDQAKASSVTSKSTSVTSHRSRGGRVGRRSVEQVRQGLSSRDLAILASVAGHRFLTTRHVESLHFANHATSISSARSARRVLRRLGEVGVLNHLERRIGGVRAGSAGFIWTVGPFGARINGNGSAARWRRYEPSLRLLQHYLAIADVHVNIVAATRHEPIELLSLELEPNSWRRFLGLSGEPRLLRPDLMAVTSTGPYEDHWFLEVDLGTEHPPTVVEKCRLYVDYANSGEEQERLGVFPRVVWIVLDEDRQRRLQTALQRAQLDDQLFRVVTAENLLDLLMGGAA